MYHPALDPYHSAFRMLSLLARAPQREYERAALRILDFYAIFPELIQRITFPRHLIKQRRAFSNLENPYWFNGEPALVFARMQHLQETALDLLYAQGLLDSVKYKTGQVQIALDRYKQLNLPESTVPTASLIEFLVTALGTLPFHGVGGLKDRTQLLEYRYDNA